MTPSTASAVSPLAEGQYEGKMGGITTTFFLQRDAGDFRAEGIEIFRSNCGRQCSLIPSIASVQVENRKVSFVATGAEIPLSRVVFHWQPRGNVVEGTITALRIENGAEFAISSAPIKAELVSDEPLAGAGAASGAAASTAPATTAATRPEYVSQLDPICASYEKPAVKLVDRFYKQTIDLIRLESKRDASKLERRLVGPFVRLVSGAGKLTGKLTAQIAAVPAPTGDEAAVASWVDGRRGYRRTADRAVRAGKAGRIGKLFGLLGKAVTKLVAGEKAVAGFGFESCV
jgi:hypothetical protein